MQQQNLQQQNAQQQKLQQPNLQQQNPEQTAAMRLAAATGDFQVLHEIVAKARQNLNQNDWDYIVGAAETETTLRRNRLALDSIAFRPRVLRDVSRIDTSAEAFGRRLRLPVMFAPVGSLVPIALKAVRPGGIVVCAGIHMSDIPSFPYELLWGERTLRSVANLTRRDGDEFFARLQTLRVETRRTEYPLEQANEALHALRSGELTGTAVLVPSATSEPGAAR